MNFKQPASKKRSILTLSLCTLIVCTVLLVISLYPAQSTPTGISLPVEAKNTKQNPKSSLPVIGSKEKLQELAEKVYKENKVPWYKGIFGSEAIEESAVASDTAAGEISIMKQESSNSVDFSTTNIQVEGVDEADIIKTDGTYLYQLQLQSSKPMLVISKIFPVQDMSVVQQLTFQDENFYPTELYLDQQNLVVIGQNYQYFTNSQPIMDQEAEERITVWPNYQISTTKAFVYDISNVENTQLKRELEIEGQYLSSRKIDQHVYIVTNQYLRYTDPATNKLLKDIPTPLYRDTSVSKEYQMLPYDQLYYFPEPQMSTLNVAGFALDQPSQALQVTSYLGGGRDIYGNKDHLFVTVPKYEPEQKAKSSSQDIAPSTSIAWSRGAESTDIYKFAWQDGQTEFLAQGNVPGRILNQFSMDEYDQHFRLATTYGDPWREDELQSKNYVFILDDQLETVGKIENIAPGEQIYSVRFMGDQGYVVTFKTTDPLFVLDLHKPTEPVILGELKIPGFSDYLHPYDQNHLIGFGKDTSEFTEKDVQGNSRTFAIQKGVKMSLFDVSDPKQPKEKFVEIIGDRGTHSPLNYTHKALMFSKAKNMFAFPIEVSEIKQHSSQQTNPLHVPTQFAFQGAYIYGIDPEQGFQFKGRISHLTHEEMKNPWDHYTRFIERVLYIDDTIYTVSSGRIQANNLSNLEQLNALDLDNQIRGSKK